MSAGFKTCRRKVICEASVASIGVQLRRQSLQCSRTSSLELHLPTDLKQLDLSYSRFRQSLKTFVFGLWNQSAV